MLLAIRSCAGTSGNEYDLHASDHDLCPTGLSVGLIKVIEIWWAVWQVSWCQHVGLNEILWLD